MYLYGKKFLRYSLMHPSSFVFITNLKTKSFSLIPPIRTANMSVPWMPELPTVLPLASCTTGHLTHYPDLQNSYYLCQSWPFPYFMWLFSVLRFLLSSFLLGWTLWLFPKVGLLPTPLILVYAKSHGQRSLVGLSMGLQRAGHDWATEQSTHMFINYLQNPYPGLLLWSTFSALISRELNLPKNNHINLDIDHYRNMVSGLVSHCNMVPISVYFPSVFKE